MCCVEFGVCIMRCNTTALQQTICRGTLVVWCSELQCVSVVQWVAVCESGAVSCSVLQCVMSYSASVSNALYLIWGRYD